MDMGELAQRLNIPNRWTNAVVSGLAARLAYSVNEVDPQLIPLLEAKADKDFNMARMEEREKAPMRIQPNIYRYTT